MAGPQVKLGMTADAPTGSPKGELSSLNSFLDSLRDSTAKPEAEAEPEAEPEPEAEAEFEAEADAEPAAEPAARTPVVDEPLPKTSKDTGALPFDILPPDEPAPEEPADADGGTDDPAPAEVSRDPKAAHAWAELKRQNKELKKQLEEASKASAAAPADEVESLRSKLSEYEEKVGQFDLTATQAFQQRYDTPMRTLLKRGIALLTKAGMEPAEASKVVQGVYSAQSQEAIEDLVAGQPVSVQGALAMYSAEYSELASARAGAVKDWRASKAALAAQQERDQEIAIAEMAQRDIAQAMSQSLAEGNWMFRRTNGQDPEWDKKVAERELLVRGLVKNAKPSEIIKWVIEGVTAKPLRELYAFETKRARKLQQELEAALGGSPRLGASGTAGRKAAPKPLAKGTPKSPESLIDAIFKG